jgi:predicted RNA-binding Zn-ribbon protein involved in translation (DUF1610 family)
MLKNKYTCKSCNTEFDSSASLYLGVQSSITWFKKYHLFICPNCGTTISDKIESDEILGCELPIYQLKSV